MEAAGVEWRAQEGGRPFLHPGRSATIVARQTARSSAGSASCTRSSLREWELDGAAAAFELDVDPLLELAPGRSPPTAT